MFVFEAQSDQLGDVIDVVGETVGEVPWVVVFILVAMIILGLVLVVTRIRANASSPDHKPLTEEGRGKN